MKSFLDLVSELHRLKGYLDFTQFKLKLDTDHMVLKLRIDSQIDISLNEVTRLITIILDNE